MPRLLLFASCERAIEDKHGGGVSLVNLFPNFGVTIPGKGEMPKAKLAPINWAIFSYWTAEPEEIGKKFVQWCELFSPSGASAIKVPLEFAIVGEEVKNIVSIEGFPVSEEGTYSLKLSLDSLKGQGAIELQDLPMTVKHRVVSSDTHPANSSPVSD